MDDLREVSSSIFQIKIKRSNSFLSNGKRICSDSRIRDALTYYARVLDIRSVRRNRFSRKYLIIIINGDCDIASDPRRINGCLPLSKAKGDLRISRIACRTGCLRSHDPQIARNHTRISTTARLRIGSNSLDIFGGNRRRVMPLFVSVAVSEFRE